MNHLRMFLVGMLSSSERRTGSGQTTQRNLFEIHVVHTLHGGQVDIKPIMQNGGNIALSMKVI